MPPRPKKKRLADRYRCDELEGERFHAGADDIFRYNWWEVFCFPYILCARFWECCVSLCAGTNQCLIYWMMIQWLVCKITRVTTPDPIIFPYYFYMFCQVILLTMFFVMLWMWLGKSIIIPYFIAFYDAFIEVEMGPVSEVNSRLRFRKYCFRKGEIFDNTAELSGASPQLDSQPVVIMSLIIDVFIYKVFY